MKPMSIIDLKEDTDKEKAKFKKSIIGDSGYSVNDIYGKLGDIVSLMGSYEASISGLGFLMNELNSRIDKLEKVVDGKV
jgi:hypothetical protein